MKIVNLNTSNKMPGLDFLLGLFYISSMGFCVRKRDGNIGRPSWYLAYNMYSVTHKLFVLYVLYASGRHTRNHYGGDVVSIQLFYVSMVSQLTNASITKLSLFLVARERCNVYQALETFYTSVCTSKAASCHVKRRFFISISLHFLFIIVLSVSCLTVKADQASLLEYFDPPYYATVFYKCLVIFTIVTMATVVNATVLVVTLWAAALAEACRSLNRRLKRVIANINNGINDEFELNQLIQLYHKFYDMVSLSQHSTGFRVFCHYTATTFNLIITATLVYSESQFYKKLWTVLCNMVIFVILTWTTIVVHGLVQETNKIVTIATSLTRVPANCEVLPRLALFISHCKHQDVRIDAMGFFKIDLPLIVKIVGTILTYTIVLLQMQSNQKNDGNVRTVVPPFNGTLS